MKLLTRNLAVLVAMSSCQFSEAREELWAAKMENIKVATVAPEIQEQLDKANPEKRKILEAAIHTGNLFVPQHFSGNAYVAGCITEPCSESDDWLDDVSPLVMTNEKWVQEYGSGGANMRPRIVKDTYQYRLTCPQVSFVAIQQDERTTTLTYKAVSMGTLLYFHERDLYDFTSDGAGEAYEVRLVLDNRDALVNRVIQKDDWQTEAYTSFVAYMNDHSEHPSIVLTREQAASHAVKDEVAKIVRTYRNSYQSTKQKIEKSAAKFCK